MRKLLTTLLLVCVACGVSGADSGMAAAKKPAKKEMSDRQHWAGLAYRIAAPVLENMSKGELHKNWNVEYSPTWDNRSDEVAYLEAFGRLMAGISPWLALPDDDTAEGRDRRQLREWALASYRNAVDPDSPDCLRWDRPQQVLVDASYLALSFIRAREALWEPLDAATKQRYIEAFRGMRRIQPPYNNWLLFRVMIEAFFVMADEPYDGYVLNTGLRKINEWYVGDGWYSDGPDFSFDNYNAYVIQPYIVEITDLLKQKGVHSPVSFDLVLKRMRRYDRHVERLISPEGTYPAFGRSATYRMAAFHTLALSSWKYGLHEQLSYGQVRSALTAVMKRMFAAEGNFDADGFLQLGFTAHQTGLADYYTNAGSLYITSLVFLPLGLAPDHDFWTAAPEKWTSQKAWDGEPFPKDYHESIRQ
ncbi:DUF2264 domain-containing protein [Alistipes sp. OttesenSCG-928-B03]|nr:DUF2264 domain-containing protein [Alistipes sp. OttesenSCG-928-B03]